MRRVLEELSTARDREILFRFYVAEEDKEEIAADHGLTSLQFNRVLHRARERYRALYVERIEPGGAVLLLFLAAGASVRLLGPAEGLRSAMRDAMPEGPLDHDTIAERSLIERYLQGTLSPDEEERFEAHFLECAECQEALEAQRGLVRGLKSVAAEEAVRTAVRLGLLAWLSRRSAIVALAALVFLAGGLAFGRLWRENERLEARVAELGTGPAPGGLGAPLAGVPVVLLGVLRGDGVPPTAVAQTGAPYSLAVDVGADPRVASYAVTLLDARGKVRFERRDLSPNDLEVVQLTLPGDFLPPGEYRLVARGALPDGGSVEVGSYAFRVTSPP